MPIDLKGKFVDDEPVDIVALARELYCINVRIDEAEVDIEDAMRRIEDDLEDAKQRRKKAKDDYKKTCKKISAAGQFAGAEITPLRKAS